MARKNHRPRDFERARTPPAVGQAGEIPSPAESSSTESSAADSFSSDPSAAASRGSSPAPADSHPGAKNAVGDPATVSGGVPSPRRKRASATAGTSPSSELEQTLAFVAAVGGFEKAKSLLAAAERVASQVRKLLDAR